MKSKIYPCIIIGSGPAGLNTSLYLSQAGIKNIIIQGSDLGTLTQSPLVQNWIGSVNLSGQELMENMYKQVCNNKNVKCIDDKVVKVNFSKKPFQLETENGDVYLTYSCSIAMGSVPNQLDIKEAKELWGKGVYGCAVCDGILFKDKYVAVIGSGDSAVKMSLYLSNLATQVFLIIRGDKMKGRDVKSQELIQEKENIVIVYNHEVVGIMKNEKNKLSGIRLKANKSNRYKYGTLEIDGLFLGIGSTPNSSLFKNILKTDENGHIVVNDKQETSVKGIYACGSITSIEKPYEQAITAAAAGCRAALEIQQFLFNMDIDLDGDYGFDKKEEKNENNNVTLLENQKDIEMYDKKEKVFFDFYKEGCPPCMKLMTQLEKLASDFPSVYITKMRADTDKGKNIAVQFIEEHLNDEMEGFPTIIMKNKNKYQMISGYSGYNELKEVMEEFYNQ